MSDALTQLKGVGKANTLSKRHIDTMARWMKRVGKGFNIPGSNATAASTNGLEISIPQQDRVWLGRVKSTGPSAEADYDDARYWVERVKSTTGTKNSEDEIIFEALESTHSEYRYITATNILEEDLDQVHLIAVGTYVYVHELIDHNRSPSAIRYWFQAHHTGIVDNPYLVPTTGTEWDRNNPPANTLGVVFQGVHMRDNSGAGTEYVDVIVDHSGHVRSTCAEANGCDTSTTTTSTTAAPTTTAEPTEAPPGTDPPIGTAQACTNYSSVTVKFVFTNGGACKVSNCYTFDGVTRTLTGAGTAGSSYSFFEDKATPGFNCSTPPDHANCTNTSKTRSILVSGDGITTQISSDYCFDSGNGTQDCSDAGPPAALIRYGSIPGNPCTTVKCGITSNYNCRNNNIGDVGRWYIISWNA